MLANKIESIKADILDKDYEISIAFVSEKKSQELNKQYRKKDKPTNVLSFSLRKDMGELVLCKAVIQRESKKLDKTFDQWLTFLVIHGMLHLKGLEHSSTMSKAENKYFTKYDQEHNSRNRRGLDDDTSHRGRVFKRRKKS